MTLANEMGLSVQGAVDPQEQVLDYLSTCKLMLVFDKGVVGTRALTLNDTTFFAQILQRAPQIKMLTTSRQPLRV